MSVCGRSASSRVKLCCVCYGVKVENSYVATVPGGGVPFDPSRADSVTRYTLINPILLLTPNSLNQVSDHKLSNFHFVSLCIRVY